MPAVARIGDSSDHGGVIISGSSTVFADGIGVCRLGDQHSCPIPGHGITNMVSSSTNVFADNKGVCRVGDVAGCGAKISSGSLTTKAD